MTHYERLGVADTAAYDDIKTAFHRLARKHHPDKLQQARNALDSGAKNGADGPQTMRQIQLAWECLRDADKRKQYDDMLRLQTLKVRMNETKAIDVELRDLEVVEDEETGERGYLHECRCGECVEVWESDLHRGGALCEMDCPGCCFVYRVMSTTS